MELNIKPEIKRALEGDRPVVALESTIITHGMPFPQNLETALLLEEEISHQGAVPATIAVYDGQAKIGLTHPELEVLAHADRQTIKCSKRELPYALLKKCNGGTTVAATCFLAAQAGIRVFATGGIGGVHREAQKTFDISADLAELAQAPVAVVCAGAKSILDIGLTLEYLETQSVPVVGFQTDEFPAFYSRKSGYPSPLRLDTPEEIATLLKIKWKMDDRGGVLIGNPVPHAQAMDPKQIEKEVKQALTEAGKKKVQGRDLTPFLLDHIRISSGEQSLKTNIALVKNNAILAAQVARAYHHHE